MKFLILLAVFTTINSFAATLTVGKTAIQLNTVARCYASYTTDGNGELSAIVYLNNSNGETTLVKLSKMTTTEQALASAEDMAKAFENAGVCHILESSRKN